MDNYESPATALAHNILGQVESLIFEVLENKAALEIDPYRERLFELFVMADAAGFLADDSQYDLSSESIVKILAEKWELVGVGGQAFSQPSGMNPAQLTKVRLIWSFMRMWMEWSYAWQRWDEFHFPGTSALPTSPDAE